MGKNHLKLSSAVALLALAVGLTACSDIGHTGNAVVPNWTSNAAVGDSSQGGSLYIASGAGVVVYSGSPAKYVRTISKGVDSPQGLASNSKNQLFVANFAANTVTVYNDGAKNPVETLSKNLKLPFYLAVAPNNDVYVGARSHVNIYINASNSKLKRIHVKPTGLATDASGNAYVAGDGVISVYPPGSTKPTRTISDGVDFPTQLAIDASGNLYVGNLDPTACGSVTVYDAATGTLENTITDDVCEPVSLAFDSLGNLYVGNEADTNSSYVTEYAAGTGSLLEKITKGINIPYGLALDPSDNLYVANHGAGTVTVYPPNQTSPSQTLTQGTSNPSKLLWIQ
jgi:sugar lactone lactonase YvrE